MFSMFQYLVFYFLISIFSKEYNPSDPNYIIFGQSCPTTGISSDLGVEVSRGIKLAFDEANRLGGVLNGKMLNLTVRDDGYEPNRTIINTEYFLNSSDIFGLVGLVGTPTVSSVSDMISENGLPLIGSVTGGSFLRDPFSEYFVNIRASYNDEATAMVNYLVRKKYRLKISILYQNDSFGLNAFEALGSALEPYGINIHSEARFDRNSLERIHDAVDFLFSSNPDAIVLAGTYRPVGLFIATYKEKELESKIQNVIFMSYSFVGTVSLAKELESYNSSMSNTIVIQVVPNIVVNDQADISSTASCSSSSKELVNTYISLLSSDQTPTFLGLEGYITGKLVVDMVHSTYGEFTRSNFLHSIFDIHRTYHIEGNFVVGGYSRSCNQGLHSIYPIQLINSSYFETVEEAVFEWEGCMCSEHTVKPVIFFKQSAPFSGTDEIFGRSYSSGVRSAFFSWNGDRTLDERILGISTKDDKYNVTLTLENLLYFLNDTKHPTFSLAGFMGTPAFKTCSDVLNETKIPSIGFFSGNDILREHGLYNIINIRIAYFEELATIVQYAFNLKLSDFSIFYMEKIGMEELQLSLEEMLVFSGYNLISSSSYNHQKKTKPFDFQQEVDEILENGIPELVILAGTALPMASFVKQVLDAQGVNKEEIYFGCFSLVDALVFTEELNNLGVDLKGLNLFISEVVPFFNDTSKEIVVDFRKNMEELGFTEYIGFISMEGFLCGKLITEILGKFSENEIDALKPSDFLDKLYEEKTIHLKELTLGPYSRGSHDYLPNMNSDNSEEFCNTGLREAWVTFLDGNTGSFQVSLDAMTFPHCSGPTKSREDFSSYLRIPLFFGLSNDLDDLRITDFSFGVELGLKSEPKTSIPKVNLQLVQKNDQKELQSLSDNMEWFVEKKKVFSYVGFDGELYWKKTESDTSDEKYLLGYSKPVFGEDVSSKMLHFRPFLFDEIFYAYQYYKKIGMGVIVMTRSEDDPYFMEKHLEQYQIQMITGTNEGIVSELNQGAFSGMIIYLLNDIQELVTDIIPFLTNSDLYTFVFPSLFDEVEYDEYFDKYHRLSFYSKNSLFYQNFKTEYQSSVEYLEHSFYGYIIGKWITSNYISSTTNDQSFFDNALDSANSISFESSEIVISFSPDCHIGIRKLYLYDQFENLLMHENYGEQNLDDENNKKQSCTLYKNLGPDFVAGFDSKYIWIFTPFSSIFSVGVVFNILLILFFCCCFYCCCICCVWCCVCCLIFTRQRSRLRKFEKLDDFYVLMEEQKVMRGKNNNSTFGLSPGSILDEKYIIPYKDIRLLEVIASGGSNAVIVKIQWKGIIAAFKCFKTMSLSGSLDLESFEREAEVMSQVSHPFIIQFFGLCIHKKGSRIGFIMEFCNNGDIKEYISKNQINERKIPFDLKLNWLYEICEAMTYLHESKRIIHRDLKCENVLLNKFLQTKVMDFGISKFISGTLSSDKRTSRIGTSVYMAPEIMNGEYDEKADVFSFSILMYIIITEKLNPYNTSLYETDIEYRVAANPFFRPQFSKEEEVDSWIKNLIISLWDHNPRKRKTFSEISVIIHSKIKNNKQQQKQQQKQEEEEEEEIEEEINKKQDEVVVVIFIMKKGESEESSERFLMIDKSRKGIQKLVKQKWGDGAVVKRIFHAGLEIIEDRQFEKLENDSLIQIQFSDDFIM